MQQVLTAQTTNGTSDRIPWRGGEGTFKVSGTFDGCTVTLQCSEADGTLVSLGSDAELTAAGVVNFALWARHGNDAMDLAVNVSGAGGSTSIDAFIGESI